MRFKHVVLLTAGLLLCICGEALAQVSRGGTPVSFHRAAGPGVPEVVMPPVDAAPLLEEDAKEEKLGEPFRFGFPHEVSYNLLNSGVWEDLDDGGRLWRLAMRCPGAYSINLIYDRFEVPDGAELFVYTPDRSTVIGAFGSHNNKEHGQFATSPLPGDRCVLEYHVPASSDGVGEISIGRIVHGYKDVFFSRQWPKDVSLVGTSQDCEVNVACPEGDPWKDEIRSVAMVVTDGGTRLCSGVLMNNAREDETPYFLTANHCLGGESTWIIAFNFESPECLDVDMGLDETVQGTTLRANSSYSDFALLELSEQPPESYNVYYAGWCAVDTASDSSVTIHHPSGDLKKISIDHDTTISTNLLDTEGDGFWRIIQWEVGATEGGSSGAPLFDWDHQVVGQLYGGYSSCKRAKSDWFGQFSESFDHNSDTTQQLKHWLDPDGTGIRVLAGFDPLKANFVADVTIGNVPMLVNFTGSAIDPVDEWTYAFGDGDSAFVQSPSHTYYTPGVYDVSLEAQIGLETQTKVRRSYIYALADSVVGADVIGTIGNTVEVEVHGHNSFPLSSIQIPVEYGGDLPLVFDSFSTAGCRTSGFGEQGFEHYDPSGHRLTLGLHLTDPDVDPELPPGQGLLVRLFFTIDPSGEPDQVTAIEFDGYDPYYCTFHGSIINYSPIVRPGSVSIQGGCCEGMTGDVDGSGQTDALDIVFMVDWLWDSGPAPDCIEEADVDGSGQVDVLDMTYLVSWAFTGGADPVPCP